jgi:hypothetical protein
MIIKCMSVELLEDSNLMDMTLWWLENNVFETSPVLDYTLNIIGLDLLCIYRIYIHSILTYSTYALYVNITVG